MNSCVEISIVQILPPASLVINVDVQNPGQVLKRQLPSLNNSWALLASKVFEFTLFFGATSLLV